MLQASCIFFLSFFLFFNLFMNIPRGVTRRLPFSWSFFFSFFFFNFWFSRQRGVCWYAYRILKPVRAQQLRAILGERWNDIKAFRLWFRVCQSQNLVVDVLRLSAFRNVSISFFLVVRIGYIELGHECYGPTHYILVNPTPTPTLGFRPTKIDCIWQMRQCTVELGKIFILKWHFEYSRMNMYLSSVLYVFGCSAMYNWESVRLLLCGNNLQPTHFPFQLLHAIKTSLTSCKLLWLQIYKDEIAEPQNISIYNSTSYLVKKTT